MTQVDDRRRGCSVHYVFKRHGSVNTLGSCDLNAIHGYGRWQFDRGMPMVAETKCVALHTVQRPDIPRSSCVMYAVDVIL